MPPFLLAQTIFANRYYLLRLLDELPSRNIQHWEARDYSDSRNVSLWVYPAVNSRQTDVFKSALASYQQAASSNLPAVHEYGVSPDDSPYFVLEAESFIPFQAFVPLADDDQLALFLSQLTDSLLALHKQGISYSGLNTDMVSYTQSRYQPLPLVTQTTELISGDEIITLCRQSSGTLAGINWLTERTAEQALTISQLNEIANNFITNKVWVLPTKVEAEEGHTSPVLSEPIDVYEPVVEPPNPSLNKWLIRVGIGIVAIILVGLFWKQIWPNSVPLKLTDSTITKRVSPHLPPKTVPKLNPSEEYQTLLQEGQRLVDEDRK